MVYQWTEEISISTNGTNNRLVSSDQRVCLNMAKKYQLCTITLMKRKSILKVLLKMVDGNQASSQFYLNAWFIINFVIYI